MQRIYTILLSVLIFVLLLVGYFHQITAMTQDLGRHFLIGEIILETGHVPLTNLFSYTYPDFPFVNMHWLSEVIFYLVFQSFGFDGLLVFSTGTILLAFAIVFFNVLRKTPIIPLSIISLLSLRILFERTDIRPEIFSFLILALFMVILYRYKKAFTWWVLLLIPLEFLWVNIHIYFIIGIGVLGLFCIDELITKRKKLLNKHTIILLLTTALAIGVTLFNPSGLTGAIYPFQVFENYGYTIEENQSIFFLESLGFHKPAILYFKISVVLLLISLFIAYKKTKPVDWFLTIAFIIIGASAVRNLPLFVFATFIPLAKTFPVFLTKIPSLLPPSFTEKVHESIVKHGIYILIITLFCFQITDVASTRTFGFGVEKGAKEALDFYEAQNLKGPIFNNFDIGSYIEYRLYPNERVFVDGRPGEYPASFFQEVYIPMQESPELFQQVSNKYGFNSIIFSHTDQTPWATSFLRQITRNPSWRTVYLDPIMIVLVKDNNVNNAIIERFGMTYETLQFSSYNPTDFQTLLSAANFANTVRHVELEKKVYADILSLNPSFCPALYNLAAILTEENDPTAIVYVSKYRQTCTQ